MPDHGEAIRGGFLRLAAQILAGLSFGLVAGAIVWRRKVGEVPERWRRIADTAEVVILVGLVALVLVRTVGNAMSPIPWDFPVFYTVAYNAAAGTSFYDPVALTAGFAEIQARWEVPADWLAEVGFWYAPPTALYLAPLGFLGYPAALVANDVVQMVMLAGAVVLLHRSFPLRNGAMGMVDMAVLAFLFRPVISAFNLSQIVFGALLALTVATATVEKKGWLGGVALGLGAMFKHLLVIPAVLALALGRWRVAVGAIGSILVLGVLAGIVFGFDVYREFLAYGPGDRSPELALDPVIQSLNGELRRLLGDVPNGPGALQAILYLPYLIAGGLMTAATWVVCRRACSQPGLMAPSFALITVLALIVYPNTLNNTLPLLIPAVAVVIHRSSALAIPPRALIAMVVVLYTLLGAHFRLGFTAMMLTWAVVLVMLGRASRRPPPVAIAGATD